MYQSLSKVSSIPCLSSQQNVDRRMVSCAAALTHTHDGVNVTWIMAVGRQPSLPSMGPSS